MFLLQGGLLALGGSVARQRHRRAALLLWQRSARNADGTPLFPLVLEPALFVAALLLATVTGLVAAFAPARAPRGSTRWWRSVAERRRRARLGRR